MRSKWQGNKADQNEPERKSDIVDATIRIIKRDGWGRVTIRNIAGELGLTTGVLWYYFADKTDILKAALLRALKPWRSSVEVALGNADPWGALVELFLPNGAEASFQFDHAWPNVVSELRREPELWAIYQREYGEFRAGLAQLVANCQKQGAIDPARNAQVEADLLCAVFDGVLVAAMGEPDRFSAEYAKTIMACHIEHLMKAGWNPNAVQADALRSAAVLS